MKDNKLLDQLLQVKAKHLKGLEIPIPSSSSQHLGSLDRKNATFDIWSLDQGDTQGEEAAVGGDELRNMSCLLPRKSKKGKLYLGMEITAFFFIRSVV